MARPFNMKRRRMSGGGISIPRSISGASMMRRTSLGRTLAYSGMRTPSRVHVFRRLGNLLTIKPNGVGTPFVGSTIGGSEAVGLQLANALPGDVLDTVRFGGAMNFKFSNVASSGELAALFENYRIKFVKLRFDFSCNSAPGGISNAGAGIVWNNAVPKIHYAPDFDDATVPTNETSLLENGYCKTARLDRPLFLTVKPRFQTAVAQTSGAALAAGGLGLAQTWLDCGANGNPAIAHYGLKFWITDIPSGSRNEQTGQATWTLMVTPTYVLELKSTI